MIALLSSLRPLTSRLKTILEENEMFSRPHWSWSFGGKFLHLASELKSKNVLQAELGLCPIVPRNQTSRSTKPMLPWVPTAKDGKFRSMPGLEPDTHHSFWPTQLKRPPDSEGWEGNITFWWRSWKTDHKGWRLQRAGDCDYFCNLLQLLSPFYVKQKKRQNWLSEKLSNFLWPVNNKAAKFQFQTTAPQRMRAIIFRKLQRFMLFETIIPFLCNLTESTYWMMKKRKVYES